MSDAPLKFRTPVDFRYLDGRRWEVLTSVVYDPPSWPGEYVIIPAGSTTDFASIPRPFWSILPPTGQYGLATVVHDRLWNHPHFASGYKLTDKQVDDIFLEAMAELEVPRTRRLIMYYAVRAWRIVR